MIEFPKTMIIGGFTFAVVRKDTNWSIDQHAGAAISYAHKEIGIREGIEGGELIACLLHEILHGIGWYFEYEKLPDREESAANLGSYGLLAFWRANPHVWAWYVEAVEAMDDVVTQVE